MAAQNIEISLLGAPEVLVEGEPLRVDTRKAVALLAYVAVADRPQRRDTLAALLWPEADEVHARGALRRTLSVLRNGLGDRGLVVERERIALDGGVAVVDASRFAQLVADVDAHAHASSEVCPNCLDPLTAAAALYRGDFLTGFTLRDSAPFDEWQLVQQESYRRLAVRTLERLTAGRAARGDFSAAIAAAARWVAVDALDEAAHRQLMILHAWTGDRSAALRQFETCERVLLTELGVSPLDETTRLNAAIVEERLPPPPTGRPARASPVGFDDVTEATDLPLVGREEEWAALMGPLERRDAAGHLWVIEGEAGIGKSRLVAELAAELRRRGMSAAVVTSYETDATLPYGVIAEALRAVLGDAQALATRGASRRQLAEASRLVPEIADLIPDLPPPPPLDEAAGQTRLIEAVAQILTGPSDPSTPVALILDDVHWADDASIELVGHLARRLPKRPLLICLVWRPELVPSGHPLRRVADAAGRSGRLVVVAPRRLDRDAVRSMVAEVGEADPHWADAVHEVTEGVPFLVMEYVAAGPRDIDGSPPGGVSSLLESRVSGLQDDALETLLVAAVIGRSFEPELAGATGGIDDEALVPALEALIERGLLRELPDGRLDFTHELLREHVYRRLSSARRRMLHRRAADAVATRALGGWATGTVAAEIANHYRLGGRPAEAAEHFVRAGDHARSLLALAEAAEHYAAALDLGHPESTRLHDSLGGVHVLAGDYGAALERYEQATRATEGDATLERKIAGVYQRLGDWLEAERHLGRAAELLGDEDRPADRAVVAADQAYVAHRLGQTAVARRLLKRALEWAEASGAAGAIAEAGNVAGVLAARDGDHGSARTHLEAALAAADRLGDPLARIAARNNLALLVREAGDAGRGVELIGEALELSSSVGDRHREAALRNNLADLLREAGRADEAMDELKRSVALFADVGREPGAWEPEVWKLRNW